VAVDHAHTLVALRARGVARQGSAGYALLSAVAGHQWRRWNVELSVDNLLDSAWTEAELIGPYRATRTGDATVGRLFTPGAPRTVLATIGVTL
jgi:TonB dependent receptor